MASLGGSQSDAKASTRYFAKDRHIIASIAGFKTMIVTQANKNAGK